MDSWCNIWMSSNSSNSNKKKRVEDLWTIKLERSEWVVLLVCAKQHEIDNIMMMMIMLNTNSIVCIGMRWTIAKLLFSTCYPDYVLLRFSIDALHMYLWDHEIYVTSYVIGSCFQLRSLQTNSNWIFIYLFSNILRVSIAYLTLRD